MKFIRKHGRIIPIRDASEGAKAGLRIARPLSAAIGAVAISSGLKQYRRIAKQEIKVNPFLDLVGLGTAVASGVLGASTFSGTAKGFLVGLGGSLALDAASTSANIASVSGRGKFNKRALQAAKQEARNTILGNAVFVGGVLGTQTGRARAGAFAGKIAGYAKKLLKGAL